MSNFRHCLATRDGRPSIPASGHTAPAVVLVSLLALGAPDLEAGAPGADLAWKYHCITCHGDRGKSNASRYPNLAGQNVPYLVSRLKYFRAATEPGNQMNAQAAPLTDEEMQILADHFSAMPR
jgi:cytochrome c553